MMKVVEFILFYILFINHSIESYKYDYRCFSPLNSHLCKNAYPLRAPRNPFILQSLSSSCAAGSTSKDAHNPPTITSRLFHDSKSLLNNVSSKVPLRRILQNFLGFMRRTKRKIMRSLMALSMMFLLATGGAGVGFASKMSIKEPIPVIASARHSSTPSSTASTEKPPPMKDIIRKRVQKTTASIKKILNIEETAELSPAVDALESITTGIVEAENEAVEEFEKSWRSLAQSLSGVKLDGLFILIVTSIIVPLFRQIKVSPIIGFLLTGTIVGPTGLNWVNDVHMIDVLGELGIVFFLFEMGLELSMERLQKMRRDVFGLGTSQLVVTTAVAYGISVLCGLSPAAAITIGGSLALSSSAFVLQLLKDKNAMGTRHGKASFGILLLQDLAVVPLIVIVELLCQGGAGLGKALTIAGIKALLALQMMSYFGRKFLNPIFYAVAKSSSQEAFLSIILSTVLIMSFFTKGIGLSDTLGAFLAGLLLAETKYRHQIEADIAPFRGLLLGVFFITVGFSIDLNILVSEFSSILGLLISLLASKTVIIAGLCTLFGLPIGSAVQCGLLTSQGGEFAFVSLGIAQRAGLIPAKLSKMLLTTVALSMAATPVLAEIGVVVANRLEKITGNSGQLGLNTHAEAVKAEMKSESYVVVCGYGRIGKMVCDMLDRKLIRYAAIDNSPQRTLEARNKGLPVFFGDVTRPEVLKGFHIGDAQACVIAIDDVGITNRVVMAIRKYHPELPIIVRAKNSQHQRYLDSNFGK